MRCKLDRLRTMSVIALDACDAGAIASYCPFHFDASSSRVSKGTSSVHRLRLAAAAKAAARRLATSEPEFWSIAARIYRAKIAAPLLEMVPGRVFIDVCPSLALNTEGIRREALHILSEFAADGIGPSRLLIKIPATWEGIRAAEKLQADGVDTLLTLVFTPDQALACADVGASVISVAIGSVDDRSGWQGQRASNSTSVGGGALVHAFQEQFLQREYETAVMATDLRSTDTVELLAGADILLIEPRLLNALAFDQHELARSAPNVRAYPNCRGAQAPRFANEREFREMMSEDPTASTLLCEGIQVGVHWHRDLIGALEIAGGALTAEKPVSDARDLVLLRGGGSV